MIDPARVALFVTPGLSRAKAAVFARIGASIQARGGRIVVHDYAKLAALPDEIIPIVGASPELKPIIDGWRARGRHRIQWDRGYLRRFGATWLPRGPLPGGYYRWHVDAFQAQSIRDVPGDRWRRLVDGNPHDPRPLQVMPWQRGGTDIVIAANSAVYVKSHGLETWLGDTMATLRGHTDRPIRVRAKDAATPLQDDLANAHCLVTHGSIAAVEAVVLGCPVFVSSDSAAAMVGKTDLREIEAPAYPERDAWLRSLAYDQFTQDEITDGTLWKWIN